MSFIAWLDYSETERRRMLDIIDLFREKGTIDELGIGTIRDAFSELLFPGTTSVMSRARYYLLVPWIYRSLEEKRIRGSDFAREARKAELALIHVIAASDDSMGNIGRRAGNNLKRLPSGIYWAGLLTWGIREFRATQNQYHRSIDDFYRQNDGRDSRGEARDAEHDDIEKGNWHARLPKAPATFPKHCSLKLRRSDAEFLDQRIRTAAGTRGSLLAELMDRRTEWDARSLIWFHPDAGSWPGPLQEVVHHARLFSEIMQGATLLYNYLLMDLLTTDSDFETQLNQWADMMEKRRAELASWDRVRFWEIVREINPRIGLRTMKFAADWWNLVSTRGARTIHLEREACALVSEREVQLKGKLSRLNHASARERWREPAGSGQLDYRWGITQILVNDIFDGLSSTSDEEN